MKGANDKYIKNIEKSMRENLFKGSLEKLQMRKEAKYHGTG